MARPRHRQRDALLAFWAGLIAVLTGLVVVGLAVFVAVVAWP